MTKWLIIDTPIAFHTLHSVKGMLWLLFMNPPQWECEQPETIIMNFFPSYCCQLCHTVKISRHIYSIHHLLYLFLLSSVVPWIRWTFTGSGTWQDDTGGLSTSSTLPFKLSRYSLIQKLLNITSLWWDQQIFQWKCTFCSVCFKDIVCISSPKFLFL